MATKSAVSKIAAKARKTKQKLKQAMIKKSVKVDVNAAKKKGAARLKAAKKRKK